MYLYCVCFVRAYSTVAGARQSQVVCAVHDTMGTTESKAQHDKAQLQDKTTDEDNANHTPLSQRRLMKLRDPRSPTDGVQRTPIVVPKPGEVDDSFEDPRSPTAKIARTPIPDDTDPRSPTEGVSRTPCPFTYPDPRSPTINVPRTPVHKECQPGEELEAANLASVTKNPSRDIGQDCHDGMAPDTCSLPSEADDCQKIGLIASDKGPSKKSRRPSLTKSIKAKINGTHSVPPRSPLSTRNLERDDPAARLLMGNDVITYSKVGSRRTQASGTPTRLVGKYEPMIDKENF
ncbi:cell division cycle-associated protein 3-like isoform X2 [Acanthaster planci]|uniref:Cell division cycle-associated protein 3-like isoform X2 n=1 Tax=Acanthaster planci TaxID=133434 RepID=A0A8B7Z2W5_ACAPL|nr:cell division cycle-associated protein 3-like isoform X2 [Acanthaster planci]